MKDSFSQRQVGSGENARREDGDLKAVVRHAALLPFPRVTTAAAAAGCSMVGSNLFRLCAAAADAVTLMQKCGKFIGAPLR